MGQIIKVPCEKKDDENHRLNDCILYKGINRANKFTKSCFERVFSDDNITLDAIINDLNEVWEFRYANGRMKKET